MEKLAIIVDSSSNIVNGQFKHVYMMPLIITETKDGNYKEYKDIVDINLNDISNKLLNGDVLKTSQSSLGDNVKLIEDLLQKYEKVVVFTLNKKLSNNFENWNLLASEYEGRVFNIANSMMAEYQIWTIQDLYPKLLDQTLTVEEIEEYMIEANKKRLVALIVPDLKFLIRGGRIKKIAGAVATLLNFKIVISLDTDGLNFYGKVIKTSQLPGKIKELFDEKIDFEHKKVKRVCFASSEFHDKKYDFEGLKEDLMKYFGFKDVGKATMPGVVMVHTGPNYFAVGIEIE